MGAERKEPVHTCASAAKAASVQRKSKGIRRCQHHIDSPYVCPAVAVEYAHNADWERDIEVEGKERTAKHVQSDDEVDRFDDLQLGEVEILQQREVVASLVDDPGRTMRSMLGPGSVQSRLTERAF